jgi:ParB family chromosome partitioning protein
LNELAATITERGIRQPVSVRRNPTTTGRWMLNFGARRLRAVRLAGLTEIPAFVDETADSYDQIIENEQRQGLTTLELALFVQRRLAAGDRQTEIAKRIGKSRTYVTFATALIDSPDWLMAVYRQCRCRGPQELYRLRQIERDQPQVLRQLLAGAEPITRERLNSALASGSSPGNLGEVTGQASSVLTAPSTDTASRVPSIRSRQEPVTTNDPLLNATSARGHKVLVEFNGAIGELVIDASPNEGGHFYVQIVGPDSIRRLTLPAARISLLRIVAV